MKERRALIAACNYPNTSSELFGCVNDGIAMYDLLTRSGYEVTFLRDDFHSENMPTYEKFMSVLREMVTWTTQDSAREIAVHFSGHGYHTPDWDGDETDGRDEVLVMTDNVAVTDDELARLLVQLPADAKALFTVDCCHSGTALDLPYHMTSTSSARRSQITASVLMLSGCRDNQTAADTRDIRPHVHSQAGAMTSCMLFCLDYATNWQDLVKLMRFVLRRKGFTQVPQLSSSSPFVGPPLALSQFVRANGQ